MTLTNLPINYLLLRSQLLINKTKFLYAAKNDGGQISIDLQEPMEKTLITSKA